MRKIWSNILALRADIVFLLLVLLLGLAYLCQPLRGLPWQENATSIAWFDNVVKQKSVTLIYPLEPAQVQGTALARFDDNLEFLGCDVAVVREGQDASGWHLTWWRAREPLAADYVVVTEFFPADGSTPIRVVHKLGQQFPSGAILTSSWPTGQALADAMPLPEWIDPNSDYRIRIKVLPEQGAAALDAEDSVLERDDEGWLLICE